MRERAVVLERGEHEQLAGDELVAALLRELVRDVEQAVAGRSRRALRPASPSTRGSRSSSAPSSERSLLTSTPAFTSSGRTVPPWLIQQGEHHVGGLDELVVAADGQRLGIGQRLLEFGW